MPEPMEEYQDAFARIEGEVDAGNTDLSALGFWRLLRDIKPEPMLAQHWAEVAGRIDRKAFERRVRIRLPVWFGNAVLLLGTLVMMALVPVAIRVADGRIGDPNEVLGGILLVAAAGGLSVTVHDPAHWLVGQMGGIGFSHYFFGGPFRIQPGIKVDYASYLRAKPKGRMAMHAAGAVATKLAPLAVFAAAYIPHAGADWELFPEWSLWALLGYAAVITFTDVVWSRKHSDWKRVLRERRVGRAQTVGRSGSLDR